ncbi:hypothetical protein Gogos_010964 [Gossypium gossypioides]|uniref:NB-ARC domain-containing protein n=1 Tax=Gossypium gossypioides TaxID=34282 RepID=A0A7J9BN38_GOSGO|nr:hypothetical protein [Gossypium gossypioides]
MDLCSVSSVLESIGMLTQQLDNEVVPTYVTEIRELAYDAEDVNESFLLKLASKRKASFSNCITYFLKEGCLLCGITSPFSLTRKLMILKVVFVYGMSGLGKITLAKKIYRCSQVISHFKYLA